LAPLSQRPSLSLYLKLEPSSSSRHYEALRLVDDRNKAIHTTNEWSLKGAALLASIVFLAPSSSSAATAETTIAPPETTYTFRSSETEERIVKPHSLVATTTQHMLTHTINNNIDHQSLRSVLTLQTPRTGRIMDLSSRHVLSIADQQEILTAIQTAEQQVGNTGDNIFQVVVTDQIMDPLTPKQMATALFNQWHIGPRDKNNGVLVLVVLDQRRVEIEVGAGIGDLLNQEWCARTLQHTTVPAFRQYEYGHGIARAIQAVGDRMTSRSRSSSTSGEFQSNIMVQETATTADLVHRQGLAAGVLSVILPFCGIALARDKFSTHIFQTRQDGMDSIVEKSQRKERQQELNDKIAKKTQSKRTTTTYQSQRSFSTSRRTRRITSPNRRNNSNSNRNDWFDNGSNNSGGGGGWSIGGSSSGSGDSGGGGYSDGDGGGADW